MSTINERKIKIKNFLRLQSTPSTVTEVHEALSKRFSLDISRKTVERDMLDFVDQGVVACHPGVPARFSLNKPTEVEFILTIEEITLILGLISPESELHRKLSRVTENGLP